MGLLVCYIKWQGLLTCPFDRLFVLRKIKRLRYTTCSSWHQTNLLSVNIDVVERIFLLEIGLEVYLRCVIVVHQLCNVFLLHLYRAGTSAPGSPGNGRCCLFFLRCCHRCIAHIAAEARTLPQILRQTGKTRACTCAIECSPVASGL